MHKIACILWMSFFLVMCSSIIFAKEISYTQEGRDRLIKVETKIEEGFKAVNQRIDALQGLIYVLIAAIFAQTIGVIGFVLWDRRSAISPVINKTKELEEKEEKIIKAFKELALKDKHISEVLRKIGIL